MAGNKPDAGFYAFVILRLLEALFIAMIVFRTPATLSFASQSDYLGESELKESLLREPRGDVRPRWFGWHLHVMAGEE